MENGELHSIRVSVNTEKTKARAICAHISVEMSGRPMTSEPEFIPLLLKVANSSCSKHLGHPVRHAVEGVAYY